MKATRIKDTNKIQIVEIPHDEAIGEVSKLEIEVNCESSAGITIGNETYPADEGWDENSITLKNKVIPAIVCNLCALDKMIEGSVKAYAEAYRKTWKGSGIFYRKSVSDRQEDKAVARMCEEILSGVFGWEGNIQEEAIRRGLILARGIHKDDPAELELLTVKDRTHRPSHF